MDTTDTLLARAQVGLAFLLAFGFIGVLFTLIFYKPADTTILTNMLVVLGTLLTLQMNYFFARHRPATSNGDDDAPPQNPPADPPARPLP